MVNHQVLVQPFLQVSVSRVVPPISPANWIVNPTIGVPNLQTTDAIRLLPQFRLITVARHLKIIVLQSIDLRTPTIIVKPYLPIFPLNDAITTLIPQILEEMNSLDLLIPMALLGLLLK